MPNPYATTLPESHKMDSYVSEKQKSRLGESANFQGVTDGDRIAPHPTQMNEKDAFVTSPKVWSILMLDRS
jgi:uncharacterized Rossmann fold enzyme